MIEHELKQPFPDMEVKPESIKIDDNSPWFEYDEETDTYVEVVEGVQ